MKDNPKIIYGNIALAVVSFLFIYGWYGFNFMEYPLLLLPAPFVLLGIIVYSVYVLILEKTLTESESSLIVFIMYGQVVFIAIFLLLSLIDAIFFGSRLLR